MNRAVFNENYHGIVHTKFGTAKIDGVYYRITSTKEGNYGKRLHRLIFEDFYKITLLQKTIVHHKDGNKLNNCILNLEAMPLPKHSSFHNAGFKNGMYGKKHSDITKQKISEYRKNKKHTKKTLKKMSKNISKSKNTTGYYRVSKHLNKNCKQGFEWVYEWQENNIKHKISSVDIQKLKQKVISQGLEWFEYNEEGYNEIPV